MAFFWSSYLLLAPMLLGGLLLAGLIHVLISRKAILRWLRGDNLRTVATSAALGVPVPLCSCSVVPVVSEMRRKGASRPACMSFLITAPETGADSILVTHAFFGFAAAVARPLVSFVTAVVAGALCIAGVRSQESSAGPSALNEHHGDACGGNHSHVHVCHAPLVPGSDDCYVSPARLRASAIGWFRQLVRRRRRATAAGGRAGEDSGEVDFRKVVRHALRYGFVEVADDILFALLLGVLLGGVLYAAVPDDLLSHASARWLAYPAMVLVGMPLYICASASTPIAAALVAKGLSPGAALVFLMTGPATNSGTIAMIVSQFGARFASVYVGAVTGVTLALGIGIDLLLAASGWMLPVRLEASHSAALQAVQWTGAIGLIALMAWRFRAGALRSGWRAMVAGTKPLVFRRRRT